MSNKNIGGVIMSTKYIFVTGGVVSSLGKGITAASLGRLLKNRGLKVSIQKFDPYINVDAENLYEVPLMLHKEGLDTLVCKKLKLNCQEIDNSAWISMVDKLKNL